MEYTFIKDISIPDNLPEEQRIKLEVFQKAMQLLEDEYVSIENKTNPYLLKSYQENAKEANKKRIEMNEMRETRLSSCEGVYEEEKKNLEKKFENANKSIFERIITSVARCDNHLMQELRLVSTSKRRRFEHMALDFPKYPQDSQIMQKVLHVMPRPLNMVLSEHEREHDLSIIKAEISSLEQDAIPDQIQVD
ncbi:hypothetical protein TRFO_36817 [Tritrichomonas foetus]|uniref:Uncharacterized protein n=1 Tax=Tritrichomonas foetus TaxID=1144522 RepID=A0A1J4JCY7_9EUKA|nr:hypothetical protein TRFO_36817 [Tritrichomonas foetus]|eukprot:OHS97034.1 hypothetical protein TRFO_36817 [Tritrichomonas foetus]